MLMAVFLLMVFFAGEAFFLTALNNACRCLPKKEALKQLEGLQSGSFYDLWLRFFAPKEDAAESFFFCAICAQNIAYFCYAATAYIFLSHTALYSELLGPAAHAPYMVSWFWLILSFLGLLIVGFLIGDFLPRIFGYRQPQAAIRASTPWAVLFMILVFPLTHLLLKLAHTLFPGLHFDYLHEPIAEAKQEIIEIVHRAELSPGLNLHDKKLISSVLDFRERIVREVMTPRVDLFCLPVETTIAEAAHRLYEEGYSRVPVYKNSIDNITGILMYKDVLNTYMEYARRNCDPTILAVPIDTISKPALYTPETKKISNLLLEFRKKQVHLAIVVDEYGGTEGLVTIEDILEEIVGDISDEYDKIEELAEQQSDQSWIVDARLSIFDAEEQLGVVIPQEGDYDTVGGYIYYRTGTIPPAGFAIHHDDFELEVITSNERTVEKVRITPCHPTNQR
jgi:CBS domain containing-hemolysin-like protein